MNYGHFDPYKLDSSPNPLTGEAWGGYYTRHVSALTEENLHAKSEIAAELAWRDLQIDRLTRQLQFKDDCLQDQLCTIKALIDGCEKYGLTETTPVVRHIDALEKECDRLREIGIVLAEVLTLIGEGKEPPVKWALAKIDALRLK